MKGSNSVVLNTLATCKRRLEANQLGDVGRPDYYERFPRRLRDMLLLAKPKHGA